VGFNRRSLVSAVIVTTLVSWFLVVTFLPRLLAADGDAQRGVTITGAVVAGFAFLGLLPLPSSQSPDAIKLFTLWMIGTFIRFFGCLSASVILVIGLNFPAKIVLLTMLAMYLPILAVETLVLVRNVSRD